MPMRRQEPADNGEASLFPIARCSLRSLREAQPRVGRRRGVASPTPLHIRDFTNGHGSDVDGPIRHAKPDRRTHTREVHRCAVPHRPDIHQPPLAAALR
jgi:hypothetical protein